ncbi:hypothetical protein A2U01_0119362, partial [Trifolium medium]|nr:hypothetical protein [Trifolium medium]
YACALKDVTKNIPDKVMPISEA